MAAASAAIFIYLYINAETTGHIIHTAIQCRNYAMPSAGLHFPAIPPAGI